MKATIGVFCSVADLILRNGQKHLLLMKYLDIYFRVILIKPA